MILLEVVALTPFAHERVQQELRRRRRRRMRDRHGRAVEIGEWLSEDWDGLLAMYRSFDVAQRAQGLPPLAEGRRAVWVDGLLRRGPNVIARSDGRVVGHAAAVRDGAASYELVVFIHQDYQGAGIGRALLAAVVALARRRGAERVWVSVERHNARAIALYRRMGFRRVSEDWWGEQVWALGEGYPSVAHIVADLDELEVAETSSATSTRAGRDRRGETHPQGERKEAVG